MKKKNGFTIIEVSIYLALSGLLVIGVIAALTPSINQQRFYDATQNFADFLRNVYSQVANPQSVDTAAGGGGRSDRAIYGKLIVFGETKGLDGTTDVNNNADSTQTIYVYDVVGDASKLFNANDVKEALKNVEPDIIVKECSGVTCTSIRPAGLVQEYAMRWGTAAEKTDKATDELQSRWTGLILIVRHPSSGTVSTLVNDSWSGGFNEQIRMSSPSPTLKVLDWSTLSSGFNVGKKVDFCVNRDSASNNTGNRWNVRIEENAHNPTDVKVLNLDDTEPCNR